MKKKDFEKEPLIYFKPSEGKFNIFDCDICYYKEEYYKSLGLGKADLLGIDTGFSKLNQKISGLRGLVICAGVPKTGKTTYILQLSYQAAERGVPVIFYSLEMNKRQILTKILSRLSGISYLDILLKSRPYLDERVKSEDIDFNLLLTEEERLSLLDAERQRLNLQGFYIRGLEDSEAINFANVKKEINLVKNMYKSENILIVIDHLQVFPIEISNYRDQVDKENSLIKRFNEIQKSTNSTIVLISQKNKESFKSKKRSENSIMAGVKGSVDLVYLASLILSLSLVNKSSSNSLERELELTIISRDTAGGKIKLLFNGELSKFKEID